MKVISFSVPKTEHSAFRLQVDKEQHFYDQLHQHSETQIMLIGKGEGTLIAGDYVGRFAAGDLFLIGSHQPHVFRSDLDYYKPDSTKKSQALSLYFDENYAGESFWQLDELQAARLFLSNAGVGYKITGETKEIVTKALQELPLLQGLKKMIGFIHVLHVLSQSQELIALSHVPMPVKTRSMEDKRMNEVLNFTFRESHRRITIEEVADTANLSAEAFCRYFKLRTRKTYINFLNEVRISNACKMLIEKNKHINQVCFDSGFSNLSHFNRTFKSITGKTPRTYLP